MVTDGGVKSSRVQVRPDVEQEEEDGRYLDAILHRTGFGEAPFAEFFFAELLLSLCSAGDAVVPLLAYFFCAFVVLPLMTKPGSVAGFVFLHG